MKESNFSKWKTVFIIAGIVILVNIISSYFHFSFDLTQDKRFTLTKSTKDLVKKLDDVIYIKVLLDGEFPAGFKRLRNATQDYLEQIKSLNPRIQYEFENPLSGTSAENKKTAEELGKNGIIPTSLKFYDGTQYVQKPIYPYALISIGQRKAYINLLEEQTPGSDEDVVLNNSVSLIEYKFSNIFQKILLKDRRNVGFTSGNGELDKKYLHRLTQELTKYYDTGYIILDSLVHIDTSLHLLILPAPTKPISLQNQFKLDQYLMRGGKIIWVIEKLDASLDSIAKYKMYIPKDITTGLDDMLFKYGVRVQPNLIMDMQSSSIPQIIGMAGDKPQTQMFSWPYHLNISSKSNHVINKNIDRVNMFFPSSIDTLANNIKKTVLLQSSPYSRTQFNPVRLNFEILKFNPDPAKYNDGNKPTAVLLEGSFDSYFKNRVPTDFKQVLEKLNLPYLEKSKPTKQIVISDVDFMQNLINNRTQETEQIGFNKWEIKYYKGNRDFILNAIEYLLDDNGVLESRSKEIKLRLLDPVKTKKEKSFWQLLNIVLPVAFIGVIGLFYTWRRRKKYA